MANRGSVLTVNDYLRTNDCLVSPSNNFFAIMQSDGNLCVYEGTPDNVGNFRWGWTDWSRNQDDYFTIMQSDGNLCVYHGSGPHDNRSHMWSARTDPPAKASTSPSCRMTATFASIREQSRALRDMSGAGWTRTATSSTRLPRSEVV